MVPNRIMRESVHPLGRNWASSGMVGLLNARLVILAKVPLEKNGKPPLDVQIRNFSLRVFELCQFSSLLYR